MSFSVQYLTCVRRGGVSMQPLLPSAWMQGYAWNGGEERHSAYRSYHV